MLRIAEKLELMKGRAIKLCAKLGIRRKEGINNRVFVHIFSKTNSEEKFLGCSR